MISRFNSGTVRRTLSLLTAETFYTNAIRASIHTRTRPVLLSIPETQVQQNPRSNYSLLQNAQKLHGTWIQQRSWSSYIRRQNAVTPQNDPYSNTFLFPSSETIPASFQKRFHTFLGNYSLSEEEKNLLCNLLWKTAGEEKENFFKRLPYHNSNPEKHKEFIKSVRSFLPFMEKLGEEIIANLIRYQVLNRKMLQDCYLEFQDKDRQLIYRYIAALKNMLIRYHLPHFELLKQHRQIHKSLCSEFAAIITRDLAPSKLLELAEHFENQRNATERKKKDTPEEKLRKEKQFLEEFEGSKFTALLEVKDNTWPPLIESQKRKEGYIRAFTTTRQIIGTLSMIHPCLQHTLGLEHNIKEFSNLKLIPLQISVINTTSSTSETSYLILNVKRNEKRKITVDIYNHTIDDGRKPSKDSENFAAELVNDINSGNMAITEEFKKAWQQAITLTEEENPLHNYRLLRKESLLPHTLKTTTPPTSETELFEQTGLKDLIKKYSQLLAELHHGNLSCQTPFIR